MLRPDTRFWVRILHIPSGISALCTTYRSQHKNRESAFKRLLSLLYSKEQGIEPSKEVIRTYTLPEDDIWPDDLMKYARDSRNKGEE